METTKERTRCEIWSRVMGYFRPVSGYNEGKKSEFYSRKNFKENIADNEDFINKFK